MSQRLQALETERNERNGKDRIELALRERKVIPADLEAEEGFLAKLAADQPDTFDKIMKTRQPYPVDLTIEVGSGSEGAKDEDAADKLFRLTDEAMTANAALSPQDARALVLAANPDLRKAIPTTKTGTR